MALASDSSNFEIILFFLIDILELLLFEISFFHRIANNIVNFLYNYFLR